MRKTYLTHIYIVLTVLAWLLFVFFSSFHIICLLNINENKTKQKRKKEEEEKENNKRGKR
jgi:hypothetical protein